MDERNGERSGEEAKGNTLEQQRGDELSLARGQQEVAIVPGLHVKEIPLLPQLRDVLLEDDLRRNYTISINNKRTRRKKRTVHIGITLPASTGFLGPSFREPPPTRCGRGQQTEPHDKVEAIAVPSIPLRLRSGSRLISFCLYRSCGVASFGSDLNSWMDLVL
ncbi:hypothetical protein BHE74_00012272 [Ensete ventricosum]|uniref:Uncharacterized protein n=1 Tax=Ensete ventricosum TaxID=4639 RepID=A0A427AKT6_ENSVE|nr:hypothetical protein B296_00025282 [Ensete ventricosum]RWV96653.1 hypothetical protein GW17_00040617 [Ensete ventricosum]RWW79442.1 hypothetical protein BHE74_00012272 [Ensete ventricosum]